MNSLDHKSKRLLLLACSQRKRPDPGLLPAIERYDGPQFQVLRKFLREQPIEAQSVNTFILSANFGLISVHQPIPNYDYRMSPQRAQELQSEVISELEQVLQANHYHELFISLGQDYWQALAGYEQFVTAETKITIAQGSQGGRQAALRRWLDNGLAGQPKDHSGVAQSGKARIRGIEIALTPEQVLEFARQALVEGSGDPTGYQSVYVLVDGQRVTPKWLVSQLTGLPVGSFHTGDARRVLEQLGVEVKSI
jgi:hypothetical protein